MESGSSEIFSVCQFFPDGTYEYVRKHVPVQEAVQAFMHYTTSVGAKMGTTVRVIVTDSLDCTNLDWEWEKGVVYPPEVEGRNKKGIRG